MHFNPPLNANVLCQMHDKSFVTSLTVIIPSARLVYVQARNSGFLMMGITLKLFLFHIVYRYISGRQIKGNTEVILFH